jgi:hypothetical protein
LQMSAPNSTTTFGSCPCRSKTRKRCATITWFTVLDTLSKTTPSFAVRHAAQFWTI